VGDSLAIASVGGSDACKAVVVEGHKSIGELITTPEGRQAVAEVSCGPQSMVGGGSMW